MRKLSALLLFPLLLLATASTTDSDAAKGRAVRKQLQAKVKGKYLLGDIDDLKGE